MKARIATLPGDGVGPEVIAAAVAVLQSVATHFGHDFSFDEHLIGGAAIDATGEPLPAAILAACRSADAVLLGAVGGSKWSDPNAPVRPEQGLLALRAGLGVYANLRPLKVHPALAALSPLKNERLRDVDVLFVRELTGGAYFGAKTQTADAATDECRYTVAEVERVAHRAFELARARRRHVTSVDKANVLETSRLWRRTVTRVATDYPDVTLEHPLPTELDEAMSERVRSLGNEFGATTGRPRRCGWFDAIVVRYAARINGLTDVAVTKLDVLDTLDRIAICTGYEYEGDLHTEFPGDVATLDKIAPRYEWLEGWQRSTADARRLEDLPTEARRYLDRMQELIETPVTYVSVGTRRDQIIGL